LIQSWIHSPVPEQADLILQKSRQTRLAIVMLVR
jgi:hypothetical protein